jgi:hypothetical protein
MDHHVGSIAKLGTQSHELAGRFAKVSIRHYDYFHLPQTASSKIPGIRADLAAPAQDPKEINIATDP